MNKNAKRICQLEDAVAKLEAQMKAMKECHFVVTEQSVSGFYSNETTHFAIYRHNTVRAITEKAGEVTLGELARLVIDGEPIERKSNEKIQVGCAGTCTKE